MIPRTLHYCFGMARDFGGQPWSLVHYVCVKSAVERLKPSQVYFWCEHVPSGPWWRLTEGMVSVVQMKAPREVFGNPLHHPAHRADVVRLDKMIEHGGIYLDADVFVHRDFDELLENRVVLGKATMREGAAGLCNAVILAEPGAPFICRWREEYRSFRSKGRDDFWDEHSVKVPMSLAKKFPNDLKMLPAAAFFWPSWTQVGVERIFNSTEPIPSDGRYVNHLWESMAWERFLEGLAPRRIRGFDSNFHLWARPLVSNLPDNYGEVAGVRRAAKRLRQGAARIRQPRKLISPLWHGANRAIVALFPGSRFASFYRRRLFRGAYTGGAWGLGKDGLHFSGVGSVGKPSVVYADAMAPIITELARVFGDETTIVDLGCGDFRVGATLLEKLRPVRYIGCDIVPEVIAENRRRHGTRNVTFRCLDIVTEGLPPGHIYLVRQVLQHLPNRDIARVLAKLGDRADVYITDAQPQVREGPVNPDKPIGSGVRFNWKTGRGRGVELDQAPFNLSVEEVCRASPNPEVSREIIITYRILTMKAERVMIRRGPLSGQATGR